MNRRDFFKGAAAAAALTSVGVAERFLVGRYGVPEGVSGTWTAIGNSGRLYKVQAEWLLFALGPSLKLEGT